MKITKYTFILPLLLIGIFYLLCGFVAADIDFRNWDIFGRLTTAIFSIFLIVFGIALSKEIKNN